MSAPADELQEAYFERFSLELPSECVRDCSHSGPCDDEVAQWASRVPRPGNIDPGTLARELRGYGAWDAEELEDDEANWRRIIWIAACNIKEASV